MAEGNGLYQVRLAESTGQGPAQPFVNAATFFTNFNNTNNNLYIVGMCHYGLILTCFLVKT